MLSDTQGVFMAKQEKQFYTVKQTAEALNTSYITIYRKISTKEMPSIKLGKKNLIPVAFIDRLISNAMSSMVVS